MVGWAGAPQGAPVSDEAGKTNSVQSTTRKIGLFGGGNIPHSSEAATMATIPTQTHPLLTVPFSAATDFTVLADHCENFAETLIESDDPALRLALGGRLAAGLALLRPTLNEPVPRHLLESLTVDTLPAVSPCFDPDSELLCDYCLTLAQFLVGRALSPEAELMLTGLLAELVWYFTAELKAPRWIRTADGVKCINEEEA
ncbi:ash family protein [Brenneria goodwinii]|uniref:ash family protein n=1 Tax=Brenneria goodwinii TaxID=1109412 RepID=UPI0036EB5446